MHKQPQTNWRSLPTITSRSKASCRCRRPTRPVQIQSWGWSYGWPLAIAPQLEQNAVFNAFNFSAGMFGNASGETMQHGNDTIMFIQLATLICPSDGTPAKAAGP